MTANRPLNLGRAKTLSGKLLWDPDCHRPLLRKDAFFLPNSIGQRTYSYDGCGNLYQKAVIKGSAPALSVNVDATTNRLTGSGYVYDANGNFGAYTDG